MSAQSSARSKRRQSALFSSHGRPSLLPLPQISVNSIVTSTPARGLQRHVPAPLPTPQTTSTHLLSTPARVYDDNTTFFGFSPGAEADETALLAIDYRSAGQYNDIAQEEQLHDDLFEETAILEQKAFSNRRTSHEGDQSVGGLGALIFSNLLANSQSTNALERLELGKRRDSDLSRRSDHFSPVKRNASFTYSTGGEYLVDYETDVRFGDDLLEKGSISGGAASSSPPREEVLQDPQLQLYNFASSPFARSHTPTSLIASPSRNSRETVHSPQDSRDPPVELAHDLVHGLLQHDVPASPNSMVSLPINPGMRPRVQQSQEQEEMTDAGSDYATTHAVSDYAPTQQSPSQSRSSPVTTFKSPANTLTSVHVTQPSPASEERRQARRKRRGLTASMAIMLSPVVEDRDKERSISRSCSMLVEALESRDSQNHRPQNGISAPAADYILPEPSPIPREDVFSASDRQLNTHETAKATPRSPIRIISKQAVNAFPDPVSLATILSASLSQEIDVPADLTKSAVPTAPKASVVPALSQPRLVTKQRLADPKKSAPSLHTKRFARDEERKSRSSASTSAGPSYLKPTLSRSIQQRESVVPAKRAASTSGHKLSNIAPITRKPGSKRSSSQSTTAVQSKPSLRPTAAGPSGGFSAPTISSSHGSIVRPIAIEQGGGNVATLQQSRQKLGTISVDAAPALEIVQRAVSIPEESQKTAAPHAVTPAISTSAEISKPPLDDAGLTVPRGFAFGHAFGQSRKRIRQEDAASAPTAAQQRVRRIVRAAPPAKPTMQTTMQKARRVLPEENERIAGGDPEVGPSISLTASALAIQEQSFARDDMDAVVPSASTSFDKTTHSQMLERYLRELAAIDADQSSQGDFDQPQSARAISSAEKQQRENRQHAPSMHNREVEADAEAEEPAPKRARIAASLPIIDAHETQNQGTQQSRQPRQRVTVGKEREIRQETRAPLQRIPNDSTNRVKVPIHPIKANVVKAVPPKPKPVPIVNSYTPAPKAGPVKVTDFTFQLVGQHQPTFQERLAAWQAREAEAARAGKSVLQPLALPLKDPVKQARKADKLSSSKRKSPVKAREFNWHSDKRARERKDFEERLREKEQILAELAEIRRLEAEAAEIEAVKRMRAAQVPRAHPVPAFVRSRKRA